MVNGSLMGFNDDLYCLVVEPYPSEKSWSSSVGMMTFPINMGKKVPNHLPVIDISIFDQIFISISIIEPIISTKCLIPQLRPLFQLTSHEDYPPSNYHVLIWRWVKT